MQSKKPLSTSLYELLTQHRKARLGNVPFNDAATLEFEARLAECAVDARLLIDLLRNALSACKVSVELNNTSMKALGEICERVTGEPLRIDIVEHLQSQTSQQPRDDNVVHLQTGPRKGPKPPAPTTTLDGDDAS